MAELVRSGKLTPEEAEIHPQRAVITRAVGTEPDVDVDTFSVQGEAGDLFLICSDGLTDMVDEVTILDAVEQNRGDLRAAAKELVNAANRVGGEDNITVVFFELAAVEPAEQTEDTVIASEGATDHADTLDESDGYPVVAVEEKRRGSKALPILLALGVLLIVAAAVLWILARL